MKTFDKTVIYRCEGDTCIEVEDFQIEERPTTIILDGAEDAQTVMTPGEEVFWALGNLLGRGKISSAQGVASIALESDASGLRVIVTRKPLFAHPPAPSFGDWLTTPQAIHEGIRWLGEAPLYLRTGAAHVAALLTPQGERLFRAEDVGRHNALDKALGWGIDQGLDLSAVMLLTSGRLPRDMVTKAASAGVRLTASVSAATVQGIEQARLSGMTLIGFVRGARMNIYTFPERVKNA